MKIKKKKQNKKALSTTTAPRVTMHPLRHRSMRTQIASMRQLTLDLIHELETKYTDVDGNGFGKHVTTQAQLISSLRFVQLETERTLTSLGAHTQFEHPGGIPDTV